MIMSSILGLKEIKQRLPQRSPMLMLDRAEKIDETHWVAVKNISINEAFFCGHFPGHAIMPGVLQVEAMKQLCELAVREQLDPAREKDVYIRIVEKVKFRKPNSPGDRAKIEAEVLEIANGEARCKASVTNNGGVACQGEFTLAVREKKLEPAMPQLFNQEDRSDAIFMDENKVMELMPHRFPFLFIDYIARMEGEHVIAVKNCTGNEPLFAGCPDDYAVLPESVLCEICAQAGCACVLSRPENIGKLGFFMSIDKAEFFGAVQPGDQMVIDIALPPGKSRFGKGSGSITVDGKKIVEIALMFAIVDA